MLKIEISSLDSRSNLLTVTHNGEVIAEESDYGEPEDNSFYRDWSWVPELLEKVYQLGILDGQSCTGCEYVEEME